MDVDMDSLQDSPPRRIVSEYANIFKLKVGKRVEYDIATISIAQTDERKSTHRIDRFNNGHHTGCRIRNGYIGWTPQAPNDGFAIEGGQGYIVNVHNRIADVTFVGAEWSNETETAAAPNALRTFPTQQQTWAFIVSGHLDGKQQYDGYRITVRNLRTQNVITTQVKDNYFAAATADLSYRSVIQVGDTMEVIVTDSNGNIASDVFTFEVTPDNIAEAFLSVTLDSIGTPKHSQLLQNYPNPFNPETWIPYRLSEDSHVSITIYDATGSVVQTLSLGFQSAGFYQNRGHAAYWDGKNASGEKVASGLYFYQLTTKSFQQTRRLIVVK